MIGNFPFRLSFVEAFFGFSGESVFEVQARGHVPCRAYLYNPGSDADRHSCVATTPIRSMTNALLLLLHAWRQVVAEARAADLLSARRLELEVAAAVSHKCSSPSVQLQEMQSTPTVKTGVSLALPSAELGRSAQ